MRMKKLILILIFFALTNCGYKPMFSKSNNLDFGIRNIEMSGDKLGTAVSKYSYSIQ
jgi:hypothetical protein